MAMSVGGGRKGVLADINVTPMADIMIVLLIIFMVAVPLINRSDVTLPSAAHTRDTEPKDLVVVLHKDLSLQLGDQKVPTLGDLLPRVQERLATLPEGKRVVYLKADNSLGYGEVARVLDACREAGADVIALMADKPVRS